MKKRLFSLTLALIIIAQICPVITPVSAADTNRPQHTFFEAGISGTQYGTFEEAARAYALSEGGGSYTDFSVAGLLARADEDGMVEVTPQPTGWNYYKFSRSIAAPYLREDATVKEITVSGTYCCIIYSLPDEEGSRALVYLSYNVKDDMLAEIVVRGETRDSRVTFTPEGREVETNLLGQDSFRLTDTQINDALAAIDRGGPDQLDTLEEISWFEKDGVIYFGADAPQSRAATQTVQVYMLNQLESDYPPYDDLVSYSGYVYSVVLKKDLHCKTIESWGNYTKSVFRSKTFEEKTSIQAIAEYFGIVVDAVKEGLNKKSIIPILVNGVEIVYEALQIQFANRYYAAVNRRGYVYDTTVYNDYVRVYYRSANAEFNWVYYGSDEVGHWECNTKNVFEHSAKRVSELACVSYELNVREHKFCYDYYPD